METQFETVFIKDDLHPIVKLESIEELMDIKPSASDAVEIETKIGEIFHIRKDHFKFVCVHCSAEFPLLLQFAVHVERHLKHIYANYLEAAEDDIEAKPSTIEFDDHFMDEIDMSSINEDNETHSEESYAKSQDAVPDIGTSPSKLKCEANTINEQTFEPFKGFPASSIQTRSANNGNDNIRKAVGWLNSVDNASQPPTKQPAAKPPKAKEIVNKSDAVAPKGPPYVCPECDKWFPYAAYLQGHLDRHTGKNRVQCEQCGKLLSNREKLGRHMLTHTGELPFECDFCPKRFRSKHNWVQHRIIHTKQYTFYCRPCQKGFRDRRDLRNHKARKHPEGTK